VSNNINPYDPIWYAQEALIQLEKALGMAGRVHRGHDKTAQQKGSTIQISQPGTFTAQDAPSTAQDLNPESLTITLNQWKEVKFKLTDKELSYTGEKIITDHIRPAAYAIADNIDLALNALVKQIPWYYDITLATAGVEAITTGRRILFNNQVPMNDLHFEVDGYLEEALLKLAAFTQHQGAGETGVQSQLRGSLGTKFGVEVFANQNVISQTSPDWTDMAGAVNEAAGYAVGSTSIAIDGLDATGAIKAGDILVITGHTQQYAVTADVTLVAGAGTVSISPAIRGAALVDNQVVTLIPAGGDNTTKTQNVMFHRNAFALAMAPLPTIAQQLGARVETVVDPITGLAIRSRLFYDGDTSAVYVALDVLYGLKTLNPNLAVRGRAA